MKYDLRFMNKKKNNKGFTLMELLVVISIMGVLTIISFSSFKNAQIKARDSQRKSDLNNISKALMMYYSDKGIFPSTFEFGKTLGLGFTGDNSLVYMRETPEDPKNLAPYTYVYKVDPTFKKFNLFANLENKEDSQCDGAYTIAGVGTSYCYGISSPNEILKNW